MVDCSSGIVGLKRGIPARGFAQFRFAWCAAWEQLGSLWDAGRGGLLAQAWQPIVICGSALVGAMEGSRGAGWAFIPQSPCRAIPPPPPAGAGPFRLLQPRFHTAGLAKRFVPKSTLGGFGTNRHRHSAANRARLSARSSLWHRGCQSNEFFGHFHAHCRFCLVPEVIRANGHRCYSLLSWHAGGAWA